MFESVHYWTSQTQSRLYACICGAVVKAANATQDESRVTCNRCKHALMAHTRLQEKK